MTMAGEKMNDMGSENETLQQQLEENAAELERKKKELEVKDKNLEESLRSRNRSYGPTPTRSRTAPLQTRSRKVPWPKWGPS